MKIVQILAIILATFAVAMVTSLLLDLHFIEKSWIRTGIVILLIAVEIYGGYRILIGYFLMIKSQGGEK